MDKKKILAMTTAVNILVSGGWIKGLDNKLKPNIKEVQIEEQTREDIKQLLEALKINIKEWKGANEKEDKKWYFEIEYAFKNFV